MRNTRIHILHTTGISVLALAMGCTQVFAQDQPSPGWRRASDPPPVEAQQPQMAAPDPSQPVERGEAAQAAQPNQPYGGPGYSNDAGQAPAYPPPPQQGAERRPAYGLPSHLTLEPGTFVTVRTDGPLSTDRNQVGDPFTATLTQPLVVGGVVVANRGQSVYGRVASVQKQHSDTPSRLGIELTGLTLADGTQVPIRTQLVGRQGSTTPGAVQAGTVAGTTAMGAAIGAAADWGRGAAIGAGAGAAAGLIGVLLTRNHPTVIYPETALTFRVESPVTIATDRAPQAFRFVGPEDYDRPGMQRVVQARPPVRYGPGYPGPYYAPYPYYPYYWGPSVGIYWGGGGWYHYRGRRW